MHVVLLAAQSLDGHITRGTTPGDDFSSPADKAHFRATLRTCDACVMGRITYERSKERFRPEQLPGLRRVVWTRRPIDFTAVETQRVLEFTAETPIATHARLHSDGRRRCALLGGGELNSAWLRAGLVDELYVTVESQLFGAGIPLAHAVEAKLELLEAKVLAFGGPALLRYAVKR